jgi:phosphate transport system permease protein
MNTTEAHRAARRRTGRLFELTGLLSTCFGLVVLAVLVIDVFADGLPRLGWEFLTSYPSRKPENAGILAALVGSLWLLVLTAIIAFPIGVGAAIYLEEYSTQSRLQRLIEINIANLAGVPSIIYGLLGLELFVRVMHPITGGRSVLAGALTMALLPLARPCGRSRPRSERRPTPSGPHAGR